MSPTTAQLRPPGIYAAAYNSPQTGVSTADTRIAGFVGISAKGPLDQPTRIGSWDEFVEVYGSSDSGYLARAVEGFFINGGRICYVVRIAHRARGEQQPGLEHASCAERVIHDAWDKPVVRVRARTEGKWGNNIWMRFAHSTGAKALLTQDLEVGAGEARISSSRGFEVGALVRVYDRQNSDYVILTEVKDRFIRWSSETPVNRRYRAAGPTHFEVLEFELHISLRDRREVFQGLQLHPASRRYIVRVVGEESRLAVVEDLHTKSPPPHNLPRVEPATKLAGGRDGIDILTVEDFIGHDAGPSDRAGLLALSSVPEVSMLAVPDAMLLLERKKGPEGEMACQRIQDRMIAECENLKDRFAIIDAPPTRNVEDVIRWRRRLETSFAALYWPWLGVVAPDGKVNFMPPSGHMAGLYARTDTEVGVHKAPANEPISGVVDIFVPVFEDDQGRLNHEGVNCFRLTRGIRAWGARTTTSDPSWRFINVRRLFIMLRRSLEAATEWAVFEPNNASTWKSIEISVSAFLDGLYRKGMFAGGSPAEAFYVKCDGESNPPEVRDEGKLVCEIGVAPAIPAEFMVIQVVQRLGDEEEQGK